MDPRLANELFQAFETEIQASSAPVTTAIIQSRTFSQIEKKIIELFPALVLYFNGKTKLLPVENRLRVAWGILIYWCSSHFPKEWGGPKRQTSSNAWFIWAYSTHVRTHSDISQ